MNTYRLYLYGRDGVIAQVSELECPADDFAVAFAAERARDHAMAELWRDDRLVARLAPDGGEADPAGQGPAASGATTIGTG